MQLVKRKVKGDSKYIVKFDEKYFNLSEISLSKVFAYDEKTEIGLNIVINFNLPKGLTSENELVQRA